MGVGRARGPEGLRGAIGTYGVGSGGGGGGGCCGSGVAMGYPALHVAQQQFVPADPQEDVLTPHLPLRLQLPQPPHAVLRAAQLPLQAKGQQVLRGPRRRYGVAVGRCGVIMRSLWVAMGRCGAVLAGRSRRRCPRPTGTAFTRRSSAPTAPWRPPPASSCTAGTRPHSAPRRPTAPHAILRASPWHPTAPHGTPRHR